MSDSPSEPQNTELSKPAEGGGYLRQAWLILLLAVLYGGLLAWIQLTLGPIIDKNKKQKTYSQIPLLVQGADASHTREHVVTGTDGNTRTVYQAFDAGGKHLGWVFPATGQGFADAIDLLVGLDVQAKTITGLYVLSQKETPGLGNFIKDDLADGTRFADRFKQQDATRKLTTIAGAVTEANQIAALTGATISSQAVCDIVNDVVAKYRQAALDAGKTGEL